MRDERYDYTEGDGDMVLDVSWENQHRHIHDHLVDGTQSEADSHEIETDEDAHDSRHDFSLCDIFVHRNHQPCQDSRQETKQQEDLLLVSMGRYRHSRDRVVEHIGVRLDAVCTGLS